MVNILEILSNKNKENEKKKILESREKKYIDYVCEQTGWSKEEAKTKMDELKPLGVNYRYYVKRRLWIKSDTALDRSIASINKVRRNEKKRRRYYIKKVCELTGWSEERAEKEILEANLYSGCTFRDYYQYHFWDKSHEEQSKYYTKGVVEQLLMKYNTNPKEVQILKDKNKFAKKFEDLFYRAWFKNTNLSFEEFLEYTDGLEAIITKPAKGTHGAGVEKHLIPDSLEEKKALYEEIINKPASQCEEFIKQHHSIAEFCDKSVNTVRVVTILDNDVCHHMYSVIRLGTGGLADGFDLGGIFVPVDVKTGITCTDGLNLDGEEFPLHPVSKKPTKGFQIPHWDKVLEITETAARRLKGVHMVGWDLGITENGVCLVEGNSEANYQFAQLPYIKTGEGVKYKFAQFLD